MPKDLVASILVHHSYQLGQTISTIGGRHHGWQFLAAKAAIDGKIAAIGGDDPRSAVDFGQNDERSIGGVHLIVLQHQFLSTLEMLRPWV